MSIHTLQLDSCYSEHELFQGSVMPYLDTNRFRLRVRAIQTIRPSAYRAKILGQALLAARTDANRFWMILSGNVDVAFPSTTTPAANLPTPAHAAATLLQICCCRRFCHVCFRNHCNWLALYSCCGCRYKLCHLFYVFSFRCLCAYYCCGCECCYTFF